MSYLERAITDGHAKLTGEEEHTPLACGFRRHAENLVLQTFQRGEFPEIMCAKSSGATPKLARGTRALRKPEEYRFYKGDPNNDIQPVSKEALIGAIKKCHLNNCE